MKGVNDGAGGPQVESGVGGGVDVGHQVTDGVQRQGVLDQLPEAQMVVTLVKKQSRWADQTLFTFGVSWPKQVSLRHQHKPRRLRAAQHHTRTAKNMRLEYLPIPTPNQHKNQLIN